jgi:SAM-dependent methyltransferase
MEKLEEFETEIKYLFEGRQSGGGNRYDREEHPGSLSLVALRRLVDAIRLSKTPHKNWKDRVFIDIGSGFGLPLAFFANEGIQQCIGIERNLDVAREAMWFLADHVPDTKDKIEVLRGDVRQVLSHNPSPLDQASVILCNDILFEDDASEFVKTKIFDSFLHSPRDRTGWVFSGKPMVTHERWTWEEVRWRMPMDADIENPILNKILRRVTKLSIRDGRLWGGNGSHFKREIVLFCAEFQGGGLTRKPSQVQCAKPSRLKFLLNLYLHTDFPRPRPELSTNSAYELATHLMGIRQFTVFASGTGETAAKMQYLLGDLVEVIGVEYDNSLLQQSLDLKKAFNLPINFRPLASHGLEFFERGIAAYYLVDCDFDWKYLEPAIALARKRPKDLQEPHRTIIVTGRNQRELNAYFKLEFKIDSFSFNVTYSDSDCGLRWFHPDERLSARGWKQGWTDKVFIHHLIY